jgi:phospholipid/cholesterol/gamma-HCH transport system permease protein
MEQIWLKSNTLFIKGNLVFPTVSDYWEQAELIIRQDKPDAIDISAVDALDSAGVAFLETLQEVLETHGIRIRIVGASLNHQAVLKTFSSRDILPELVPERPGYFEQLGDNFLRFFSDLQAVLVMAADVFYWAMVGLFNFRGQRKGSFVNQAYVLGFQALPVVSLLSFIIGFIIALQSAIQLRIYGGNVFIAELMSVSMVRELGPLMTAVIVSGRSGSSIASEIASMQVSEEIDALRMMAINPLRYVVVPKFHALTLMLPILAAFSILVSLLAGLFIAISYLDLNAATYFTRSIEILTIEDIVISFGKSAFFAWIIVIIGSYFGFNARGGAEDVGRATTNSVVASIISVIFFDAVFSLLYI